MRKLKLLIVYIILTTCLFSTVKQTFSENVEIEIPENIYNINDGNKSIVILNDKGNNGYGLFFLGDTINTEGTNLTINPNGSPYTITCHKQLKGYYTNSFLNFKMFPLDNETNGSNGIQFDEGGLFYMCSDGDTEYTGVYGYIKRIYNGTDSQNTHEIRAGLLGEGTELHRTSESPLKLVEDGVYKALSGYFQDYLAKNATVHTDFKEKIYIDYPDNYFTNTKAFSGNRNEIQFDDSGNDGFGLFFLGTGLENGPYEITDRFGTKLICSGQLNGHYSFSFNDFGMLPLDTGTLNGYNPHGEYVNFSTGGLYYNCKSENNVIYTGVYGYIKRNYNLGNIHEIRAGIDSEGRFYNQSPIEVIYSDNFRNINRTLSGQFHDNLSKNSKTAARFFGDIGILSGNEEIKAIGSLNDPYFILPYETYQDAKIYVKSSKRNTSANIELTEFDSNVQTNTNRYNGPLSNLRSNFGFYGYIGNIDFSHNPDLKSGTITATLTNNNNEDESRSQTIRFEIADPIITTPIIVIEQEPECSTGIRITARAIVRNYPTFGGDIFYAITDGEICDETITINRNLYTGPINLSQTGYNGQYICFKASNTAGTGFGRRLITGIDLDGPAFNITNWSGEECTTGTIHIEAIEQIGCLSANTTPFSWNQINWSTNSGHEEYSGGIGSRIITGYVQDALGNWTQHTGTFTWTNTGPSLREGTLTYPSMITGTTTLYENLITSMGIIDGLCGSSTIQTGDMSCTFTNGNGTGQWDGNGIKVTPPYNAEGTGTCTIRFADDEGDLISGTVIYRYDTLPAQITINGPTPGTCSTQQALSGTINDEGGTMRKSTGTNINTVCDDGNMTEYTQGTDIIFNSESDSGTYVCFKAKDSYGNISFATSTIINNIDKTPPSFDIITGEVFECNTGTIRIENVQQSGCALAHNLQYRWYNNGRLDRSATGVYEIYSENTGTKTLQIIVRDALGNQLNPKTAQITRKNHEITGDTFKDIGDISSNYTFNPISLFNIRGQGDCEIVSITSFECNNAVGGRTPDDETLVIIPNTNTDSEGDCTIIFTDRDTVLTGKIDFTVKTREYPIVLDYTGVTETGDLKLLNDGNIDSWINTGLAKGLLVLSPNEEIVNLDDDTIIINEIRLDDNLTDPNQRLKSANLRMEVEIDTNAVDNQFQCSCDTGVFALKFDRGFITDPALNPSEDAIINTNNIYIAGNYLVINGGDDTRTENTTLSANGFIITGYTKNQINSGTTSIKCISGDTCPGFSCSQSGITNVFALGRTEYYPIKLFGQSYVAPFNYKFNLKIDPINNFGGRTIWTGCRIEIINNSECPEQRCGYSFTEINIDLVKRPIKAGMFGEENYRKGTLGSAIEAGSGDDGFLFFITHPQNLLSGGVLGNIQYVINFSEDVADEFYYITGSAVVNGYKEDLNIKRPTYNYSNPRSYLFNFPEY